jgi:aminoglycoside phosphotransferase (APT) family kinase protein
LAEIHQCAINGLPVGAEQGIMAKVVEAETLLADFDAELGSRVKAISEKLAAKRSSLTKIAPRSIHGAFRLSQLLRVTSGLALVDFDAFQLGNPMEDVGGFVAYLLYRPMKGKLTQQQSRSAIRHFCRAYAERSPWGLPKDVLAWQTTAHLVGKHAKRSVKTMKKNVRQLVEQLLRTAVDILDGKTSLT